MRKPMIGAAVAAMALGGAAVAFGDSSSKTIGEPGPAVAVAGGPPMVFGKGPDGAFAADLAAELDGVSVGEVKRALEAVADKQLREQRRELAEAISSQLDGVSVERIESALEAADERMRRSFESGDPPSPDLFTKTVADELGLSEDEVADALAAARRETFEAHGAKGARPMLEFGTDRGGPRPAVPPPVGPGFSLPAPPN
jgi:hypothetical protein